MAKKKPKQDATVEQRRAQVDRIFAQTVKAAEYENAKDGLPVGQKQVYAIPVPSLALRYLLQNEGLLTCRVYHVLGPWGSHKSSLFVDAARWHFDAGGFGIRLETEDKEADSLTPAILSYNDRALYSGYCDDVEMWQSNITHYIKTMVKEFSGADGLGPTVPVAFGVDSIGGTVSRKTISNIDKAGHASPRFALEAKMNSDYVKAYKSMARGYPFTLWLINHLKHKSDPVTGLQERTSGGGDLIKYQMAQEIELHKLGDPEETNQGSRSKITMRIYKNSYGIEGRRLQAVYFRTSYQDDNGVNRMYARFDWHDAAIRLLRGEMFTKKQAAVFQPKINEIVDIHEKSGGSYGKLYWSKTLGVSSDDALRSEDLSRILETRCDVLDPLYEALRIARRPFLPAAIAHLTDGGKNPHILAQAEMAQAAYAKKRDAGEGQALQSVETEEEGALA